VSSEHGINDIKTGSLLTLTEQERRELLADVDQKIAELDDREGDRSPNRRDLRSGEPSKG
jgi:hypothetical protein